MVQKYEQQDGSSNQLRHTPSTQYCHGYQQLRNLQKPNIQNKAKYSISCV
jgi:hypothetical protein